MIIIRLSRNLALVMLATLLVLASVAGCGNGKKTDAGNDAAPRKVVDGGEKRPADQQVLYEYFEAIDQKRYRDAYNMWSESGQPTSFEEFKASYADYVDSVRVVSVKKLPEFSAPDRETFQVDLDSRYIKNYPAGSGEIPSFWTVVPDPANPGSWLIEAEGTGP